MVISSCHWQPPSHSVAGCRRTASGSECRWGPRGRGPAGPGVTGPRFSDPPGHGTLGGDSESPAGAARPWAGRALRWPPASRWGFNHRDLIKCSQKKTLRGLGVLDLRGFICSTGISLPLRRLISTRSGGPGLCGLIRPALLLWNDFIYPCHLTPHVAPARTRICQRLPRALIRSQLEGSAATGSSE
jgi:hypothetical protein